MPIVIIAEAGTTAVAQGLKEGDQVIINPPPGLLAGATVQVVALPAAQGQGTPAAQQPAAGAGAGRTGSQAGGQRTGNKQGQGGAGSGQTQPAAGVAP